MFQFKLIIYNIFRLSKTTEKLIRGICKQITIFIVKKLNRVNNKKNKNFFFTIKATIDDIYIKKILYLSTKRKRLFHTL